MGRTLFDLPDVPELPAEAGEAERLCAILRYGTDDPATIARMYERGELGRTGDRVALAARAPAPEARGPIALPLDLLGEGADDDAA